MAATHRENPGDKWEAVPLPERLSAPEDHWNPQKGANKKEKAPIPKKTPLYRHRKKKKASSPEKKNGSQKGKKRKHVPSVSRKTRHPKVRSKDISPSGTG